MIDLIIGLPSIMYYNLLPLLHLLIKHTAKSHRSWFHHGFPTVLWTTTHVLFWSHTVGRRYTLSAYFCRCWYYVGIYNIFICELLQHDDDAIDAEGPNDIDISRMVPGGQTNNDFTIGGSPEFQHKIWNLLTEYDDIFSFNVKGKAMAVPPMHFKVHTDGWEVPARCFPPIRVESTIAFCEPNSLKELQ